MSWFSYLNTLIIPDLWSGSSHPQPIFYPDKDTIHSFIKAGFYVFTKCSTDCYTVPPPSLLSGCAVLWPMVSSGSSSRNYSDFDNWKCTSPRQHQHCTGSLWLAGMAFLPPPTRPSLNPRTPALGGLGPEAWWKQDQGPNISDSSAPRVATMLSRDSSLIIKLGQELQVLSGKKIEVFLHLIYNTI